MAIIDLGTSTLTALSDTEIRRFTAVSPAAKCACDCGCDCCANAKSESPAGVRFGSGQTQLSINGFSASGFGNSWGHTAIFSNKLSHSDNLGQGFNWRLAQWPTFSPRPGANDTGVDSHMVASINAFDDAPRFQGVVDASGCFTFNSTCGSSLVHNIGNQTFELSRSSGEQLTFHSFNQSSSPQGRFECHTTPGGQKITVESYSGNNIGEVNRSYTKGGSTTTESIVYSYSSPMQTALLRRKVDAGAWEEIARIECT